MRAFWDLSTERGIGGGVLGPIPVLKVVEYGRWLGFDGDLIETLWDVVRSLDQAYLGWQGNEFRRRRDMQSAASVSKSRPRPHRRGRR